jgi:hypothetical protein
MFDSAQQHLFHDRQRATASLPCSAVGKLKPRYVGSYQVVELINEVAVRLQLPPGARLHDVFHVGVLKKFVDAPPAVPLLLPPLLHGAVVPAPARVTHAQLARGVRHVLVEWQGEPTASATWEDLDDFRARFPTFQLEDELDFEAGRDVMCERTYTARLSGPGLSRLGARARRCKGQPLMAKDRNLD